MARRRAAERLARKPESPLAWGLTRRAGNLPGDDTTFIDRHGELMELSRLLAASRHVTVVGPPGIGKTRLAIGASRAAESSFACGAWHVEAAPTDDDPLVALRLAITLGARAESGEPLIHAITRLIGRRRVLLLIDNCQFAPAAIGELIGELLHACPRAAVVAVAREPLGVRDEQVYRVPPLSLVDERGRDGAPALLRERARVAKATLDASPESAPAMAALCRKLRGVPLPIELAAAHAASPTFDDVTALIDDRLQTLGVAGFDAQPPEQVVRLMVDWAYHQITEGERGMLRRLSVFAGSCTLRAAAAISGAADSFPDPQSGDPTGGPITQQEARVLDILTRLASLSLLSVRRSLDASAAGTRFILHDPVRQLARDRLMEFAGAASVLKRHIQYFLALGEQAAPRLEGADGPVWCARVASELPNLVLARETAREFEDRASSDALASYIGRFLNVVGLPA